MRPDPDRPRQLDDDYRLGEQWGGRDVDMNATEWTRSVHFVSRVHSEDSGPSKHTIDDKVKDDDKGA